MPSAAESILVIHLAGIGDLLMGRLALEQLRQRYVRSRLVLLTWRKNLEAAELIPSINERYGLQLGGFLATLPPNLTAAFQLRSQRFDLAINCYQVYRLVGVVKLALLLGVIDPRRSAGRNTDGKGWCFNRRIREKSNLGGRISSRHGIGEMTRSSARCRSIENNRQL